MKKAIAILIICLLGIAYNGNAQQKEWKDLITTLDEELTFFKGKKGYIQQNTWSYTDFEIHWGFLDETYLNWSIHYYNRFSGESETVTEYFFLVDFFNIITDFALYEKFKLTKNKWANFSSINELRNRIAHPTRSLIDNENTIEKLKERLRKMNNLLFKLRQ